jgi:2-methylcitrate dehydratase PrpD
VVGTTFDDLPPHVVDIAKTVTLDWIGAAIAGTTNPVVKVLTEIVKEAGGHAEATIVGDPVKTSCLNAALVNGSLGQGQKLDDSSAGYPPTVVHSESALIPPALAVAERDALSGKDFITAITLGFDVGVRIGVGLRPSSRGYHGTGVCGTFAAAAAAGKLLGLNRRQMRDALGLAATQAAGLSDMHYFTRMLHTGKSAHDGVLAALLAQRDVMVGHDESPWGSVHIFESARGAGLAFSNQPDLAKITSQLGEDIQHGPVPGIPYWITQTRFARYGSSGGCSAAIDLVLDLTEKHRIAPGDIEEIEARQHSMHLGRLTEPKTEAEARWSLPYCLAVATIDRRVDIPQFTDERVQDPTVLALARRVRVVVDPDRVAQGAEVIIRTKDGKEHSGVLDRMKGAPENPMTRDELLTKFRFYAPLALPSTKIERIIKTTDRLDELDAINELMDLLYP